MIKKNIREKLVLGDQNKADMIVSMDFTGYKYSVFSESLLLLNKVNFTKDVEKYGLPI